MIKKADGTKIDMSSASTPTQQATAPAASQPMNTELSEEAKRRNKDLIDAANRAATQPEYYGSIDNKLAHSVFATLGIADNSIISNDDVELSYSNESKYEESTISLTVMNKTNKIIYLDLANTSFISEGESSPYYIPIAYSSSKSKTGDANAGTFAGAMGIHDYQTNIQTSTVYSQRVISIPPMSQKKLDTKWMFPTHNHLICHGVYCQHDKERKMITFNFGDKKSSNALRNGETFCFDQDNSPIKFTFFVTYSFNEDCESSNSVSLNLFMKKVIGFTGFYSRDKIRDFSDTGYIRGYIDFKDSQNGVLAHHYNYEGTVFKRP